MKRFQHLLLDIEGTIVLDKKYTPVPGSVRWLNSLAERGITARLVTNNTTESPDNLYRILTRKGFHFNKDDYFTCLKEAVVLMKRRKVRSCLVLAKKSIKDFLKSERIKPLNSYQADSVLVGYDPTLTYHQMNLAVKAIMENGATLFTLNRNRRFMNEKREIAMSAGPITAALEYACMTRAVVCGKPSRRFFLDSIKGWDVPRDEILMISDDPFADLIGAKKLGISTCWVLTGSVKDRAASEKIPPKYRPDYIYQSIIEMPL
jgi:HAD superfamily hydrolase (TIGR01458 family)